LIAAVYVVGVTDEVFHGNWQLDRDCLHHFGAGAVLVAAEYSQSNQKSGTTFGDDGTCIERAN
jgi:hypothetical protein